MKLEKTMKRIAGTILANGPMKQEKRFGLILLAMTFWMILASGNATFAQTNTASGNSVEVDSVQSRPADGDPENIYYEADEIEPVPLNMEEVQSQIGYPIAANKKRIQGKVVLQIQIDERGNYLKHSVLKNPHAILTDAVVAKIHLLRFSPAVMDHKPIKVWVTVPFDFKLL